MFQRKEGHQQKNKWWVFVGESKGQNDNGRSVKIPKSVQEIKFRLGFRVPSFAFFWEILVPQRQELNVFKLKTERLNSDYLVFCVF